MIPRSPVGKVGNLGRTGLLPSEDSPQFRQNGNILDPQGLCTIGPEPVIGKKPKLC